MLKSLGRDMEYKIVDAKVYSGWCIKCKKYFKTYGQYAKVCLDCKVKGLRARGTSEDFIKRLIRLESVKIKVVKGGIEKW